MSELRIKPSRPKIQFVAASLKRGSGGIAELSRQVLAALKEWHATGQIDLHLLVLDDAGENPGDHLLAEEQWSSITWCNGNRWRFAWGQLHNRSDLMLLDHVGLARLPGLLPRFCRPHYMLLIHGIEIWQQDRADYHRSAKHACNLIANSEYTACKSRARYPDLPPIQVCLPGKDFSAVDVQELMEPRRIIGSRAMLIVGRLDAAQRHKGHDHLLQAMPRIVKQVPDAQLVIAGAGNDQARLEELADQLGVTQQVIFTGWCDDQQLQHLYSRCALFVMPSTGDGFGLVFLEAMQHGTPCVGLQGSAAEEILESGVSGVLLDRENIDDMADQLAGLLLDAERRKKLGGAGRLRQQTYFRAQHYAARLKSILMTTIDQSHATG